MTNVSQRLFDTRQQCGGAGKVIIGCFVQMDFTSQTSQNPVIRPRVHQGEFV